MVVDWASDEGEVYFAEKPLGALGTMHLTAQSLGEIGWDWHIWDAAGRLQQRYGLADTLSEAQAKAVRALADVVEQLPSDGT